MERAVRIAVVGPAPEPLLGDLRGLPLQPEVRQFQGLYGDTEALTRFQPDLLVAALSDDVPESIGALRLLRSLWPSLGVVLVAVPDRELAMVPAARRLGAQLLVFPGKPGQLAAVVEQALLGSNRPRADVFVDLAHGIADEINNPLQFVAGHLQLLHAGCDPARERDRRDQVRSALDGLLRIQASVDRLRLLSQAANGPRRHDPLDLGAMLGEALAAGTDASAELPGSGTCVVPGDREQLRAALEAVVRFRDAVRSLGAAASLALEPIERGARLRLVASGGGLVAWRLPRTFEPYYPSRILRGHGHGLDLFVAQTVVLGHGGQATARVQPDGSLRLDFVLPA
ncbi:MAG: hypothetical protein FJ265_02815 [Planctomycetes bacterium]|nr:hypothetical protein [Planctomycetota bacterium]